MWIFFVLMPILHTIGNIYIYFRGWQALRSQSFGVKTLLTILYWGCALSLFASFLFRDINIPAGIAQTVSQVGTGWLVFTLYMVIFLVLFDINRLFNRRFRYGFFCSFFLTLCLLAYGNYNYMHPEIRVINMVINKQIKGDNKQMRVVGISDVHLGYATNKSMLAGYVEQINSLNPDLVVIAGDLIDNSVVPLWHERMYEELYDIKAPLGIYMVPGNHEYISGIGKCEEFLAKTPITLLRDSAAMLENGVWLVGRDDRHNRHRKGVDEMADMADREMPVIMLDHQPFELEASAKAGVDLQFSGHTHRGQVWPLSLIVDRMFELSYGMKRIGESHIYVSSGLSLWGPPYRIGTDSEIVVFDIKFKE